MTVGITCGDPLQLMDSTQGVHHHPPAHPEFPRGLCISDRNWTPVGEIGGGEILTVDNPGVWMKKIFLFFCSEY